MRRWWALSGLAAVLAAASCAFDRERPSPSEPPSAALVVEVESPANGATILANRTATIRVTARDLEGELLSGIGFVARRFGSGGNATLDSVVVAMAPTNEATREFSFNVPALPTNTQVDIYGIAVGPRGQTRLSIPRSVIVVVCQPGQPGC